VESLEALRRRLETGESLHSLVRTMRALAWVSIRQYEEANRSLESYERAVELGLQITLHELRAPRRGRGALARLGEAGSERVGAVVLGSAQGLAGRFNEQIARLARGRLGQLRPRRLHLLAYGPFVAEHLNAFGVHPDRMIGLPGSVDAITEAVQDLLLEVEEWRREEGVERVLLFYNLHAGRRRPSPHTRWLLPLDPEWLRELADRPWGGPSLPTHRIDRDRLFRALVREHLFVACYRAFAESLASEHASRLAAMQTAEKRIDEKLGDLRLQYHRRRQASITEELMDIVSGYEVLAGEEPHEGIARQRSGQTTGTSSIKRTKAIRVNGRPARTKSRKR